MGKIAFPEPPRLKSCGGDTDFKTIFSEYREINSLSKSKEDWQYVVGDVGQYAAIKGYDAIATNGYRGHDYMVVLNRTKLILKE